MTEFKTKEITSKISESIRQNGDDSKLFSQIISFAIAVLKEFLDVLMRKDAMETQKSEKAEMDRVIASKKPDQVSAVTLLEAEVEFQRMEAIHQRLNKCNRKLYALQKQQKALQETLKQIPRNIFHRKERRTLEDRIAGIGRQINLTRKQLETIPNQFGFDDVRSAEAVYKIAKAKLESLKAGMGEEMGKEKFRIKPMTRKQKVSVLKELAAKRQEAQQLAAERSSKEGVRMKVIGEEI